MVTCCGPSRNLTVEFMKLRAARRRKKNRFGYPILATLSATDDSNSFIRGGISNSNSHLLATSSTTSSLPPFRDDFNNSFSSFNNSRPPSSSSGIDIEMSHCLPPIWVDLVEEAHDDLSKATEKLSSLQKAQQKRLLRIFDDLGISNNSRTEVDAEMLSQEIAELFKQCEARIHRIYNRDTALSSSSSSSEIKLRQNAQRSLATQLQALSQQLRAQQKHYIEELRKQQVVEPSAPPGEAGEDFRGQGNVTTFADKSEQMSDARNQEIARIAQSMADLHTIFKDISELVIDQGTIMDRIDHNIDLVATQTRDAHVHVKKAEQYQRSGRAGRVVLFLIVMILLMIVFLILKHVI